MIPYTREPDHIHNKNGVEVACFSGGENVDPATVRSFGEEWKKFRQFTDEEIKTAGDQYFDVVPAELLNENAVVLDAGCGSGRWSRYIASKVGRIEAIDPNEAVFIAAQQYQDSSNIRFTQAEISQIPFADNTFDLVICLGVLHHIPDTAAALRSVVKKLKPRGHLLLYLYYSLDNKGFFYRMLFGISDLLRGVISRFPQSLKKFTCDSIAFFVYLPIVFWVRGYALVSDSFAARLPLGYYRDKSFRIMRNDALDRFGTPLEQRFSKQQITEMLLEAEMEDIQFADKAPFWHCISSKSED